MELCVFFFVFVPWKMLWIAFVMYSKQKGAYMLILRQFLTSIFFFFRMRMAFHLWKCLLRNRQILFDIPSLEFAISIRRMTHIYLVYGNISHIQKHHKMCMRTIFKRNVSTFFAVGFSLMPHKTLRIQLFRMKKMKFYYTKYEFK